MNEFIARNGLIAQNNSTITGSLTVTGGITGSLQGTASYALTSSNITGGAGNYVPLWSTSTSLSSSALYQSSGFLGLGLTSPNAPIHVKSTASPLVTLESTTTTAYTNLRFTGTGRGYAIGVGNDSETFFGVPNEFFIYDDTAGAIRMVIDTSGRVGVGTVSPSTTVDVNGNVRATSFTGSLLGTASFVTASNVVGTVTSASFASTASYIEFGGKALTTGYPGTYFHPLNYNGSVTVGGVISDASSVIRYYPVIFSRDTLIGTIGAYVRAAAATTTGSYRLGIYNNIESSSLAQGATALPGSLLADYGLISQNGLTSSFTEISIAAANRPTLKKGKLYWLAIAPSGNQTTSPSVGNSIANNPYFGYLAPTISALAYYTSIYVSANGGAALPDPANTASLTLAGSSNVQAWPVLKITGSIE